jgi:hypothetical protein
MSVGRDAQPLLDRARRLLGASVAKEAPLRFLFLPAAVSVDASAEVGNFLPILHAQEFPISVNRIEHLPSKNPVKLNTIYSEIEAFVRRINTRN